MTIIETGSSDKLFKKDGYNYRLGMYEVYYTTEADGVTVLVGIRHIYGVHTLVSPIEPEDYQVNGSTYSSNDLNLLVSDLSEVLGYNFGNSGGGGTIPTFQQVLEAQDDIRATLAVDTTSYVRGSQLIGDLLALNTPSNGSQSSISALNVTASRSYDLLDKSGTLAMIEKYTTYYETLTSDIWSDNNSPVYRFTFSGLTSDPTVIEGEPLPADLISANIGDPNNIMITRLNYVRNGNGVWNGYVIIEYYKIS
jgi:hypothetical protein